MRALPRRPIPCAARDKYSPCPQFCGRSLLGGKSVHDPNKSARRYRLRARAYLLFRAKAESQSRALRIGSDAKFRLTLFPGSRCFRRGQDNTSQSDMQAFSCAPLSPCRLKNIPAAGAAGMSVRMGAHMMMASFGQAPWQVPQATQRSSSRVQVFSLRSTVSAPAGQLRAQSVQ